MSETTFAIKPRLKSSFQTTHDTRTDNTHVYSCTKCDRKRGQDSKRVLRRFETDGKNAETTLTHPGLRRAVFYRSMPEAATRTAIRE